MKHVDKSKPAPKPNDGESATAYYYRLHREFPNLEPPTPECADSAAGYYDEIVAPWDHQRMRNRAKQADFRNRAKSKKTRRLRSVNQPPVTPPVTGYEVTDPVTRSVTTTVTSPRSNVTGSSSVTSEKGGDNVRVLRRYHGVPHPGAGPDGFLYCAIRKDLTPEEEEAIPEEYERRGGPPFRRNWHLFPEWGPLPPLPVTQPVTDGGGGGAAGGGYKAPPPPPPPPAAPGTGGVVTDPAGAPLGSGEAGEENQEGVNKPQGSNPQSDDRNSLDQGSGSAHSPGTWAEQYELREAKKDEEARRFAQSASRKILSEPIVLQNLHRFRHQMRREISALAVRVEAAEAKIHRELESVSRLLEILVALLPARPPLLPAGEPSAPRRPIVDSDDPQLQLPLSDPDAPPEEIVFQRDDSEHEPEDLDDEPVDDYGRPEKWAKFDVKDVETQIPSKVFDLAMNFMCCHMEGPAYLALGELYDLAVGNTDSEPEALTLLKYWFDGLIATRPLGEQHPIELLKRPEWCPKELPLELKDPTRWLTREVLLREHKILFDQTMASYDNKPSLSQEELQARFDESDRKRERDYGRGRGKV